MQAKQLLVEDACARGGFWRECVVPQGVEPLLDGGVFYDCVPVREIDGATWVYSGRAIYPPGPSVCRDLSVGMDFRLQARWFPRCVHYWPARRFEGCSFRGMDLRGARVFHGATLEGCDLRGVDARWADLEHSVLIDCQTDGANFENAFTADDDDSPTATRLRSAGATSRDVLLTARRGQESRLEGLQLWKDTIAYPSELDFQELDLQGLQLQDMDVGRMEFVSCRLADSSLRGCQAGTAIAIQDSTLSACDLSNISAKSLVIAGGAITGSSLVETEVHGGFTAMHIEVSHTNFNGAVMYGQSNVIVMFSKFSDCSMSDGFQMRGGFVQDSVFTRVDFSRAPGTNVTFRRMKFTRTRFEDCDLAGAFFDECRFESCTFTGTNTDAARFMYCRFEGCTGIDAAGPHVGLPGFVDVRHVQLGFPNGVEVYIADDAGAEHIEDDTDA